MRETEDVTTSEEVNVNFNDQNDAQTVLTPAIPRLYKPTSAVNASLNEFLSRPVEIINRDVTVGAAFTSTYYPWNLYLNHASIKRKIDNYAFIRCDLHLKFVINASPFYYGAILGAYKPLEGELNSAPINFSVSGWEIPLSQLPHVWM